MSKPLLSDYNIWCSNCDALFDFRQGCLVVKDVDGEIQEVLGPCCMAAYLEAQLLAKVTEN